MYEKLLSLMDIPVGLDADVQAFLTATSISDGTITTALSNLVAALKSAGIWSKMIAIYPIVGGTATTHKYNLKDPRDLDAAFRISFTTSGGGITHSSSGMTGGGAGNYGDTHVNPSTDMSSNQGSFGFFLTNLAPGGIGSNFSDGCRDGSGTHDFILVPHWSDGNCYMAPGGVGGSTSFGGTFPGLSAGCFIQSVRKDSGNAYLQMSTTRFSYSSAAGAPNKNLYLLAENLNGTPSFNSTGRVCKFAFAGQTLSTTEMDAYNTAVVAFQSDLGR